jgi:hypothetical protein
MASVMINPFDVWGMPSLIKFARGRSIFRSTKGSLQFFHDCVNLLAVIKDIFINDGVSEQDLPNKMFYISSDNFDLEFEKDESAVMFKMRYM